MRLDSVELRALRKATENINGNIFLFGSRVDDTKKGGDIDLLIFSQDNAFHLSQQVSIKFFMECEEKIDVVVMDKENLSKEQKAFLNVITKVRFK